MGRQIAIALYVAVMVAMIVAVDLIFSTPRLGERLLANAGMVLVFIAFYFKFLRRR